jgi:predicted Zn-dependent protease
MDQSMKHVTDIDTGLALTGEDQLFRMLSLAARVACEFRVFEHALCMTNAMQLLRPDREDLVPVRAQLLWSLGRFHEAQDLLHGSTQPFSQAVLALCAAALGRPDAVAMAEEARATGDETARALAEIILGSEDNAAELVELP